VIDNFGLFGARKQAFSLEVSAPVKDYHIGGMGDAGDCGTASDLDPLLASQC
jgi:hypothetical protein